MTLPRFVVPQPIVEGRQGHLEADTLRHLRALRLREGDRMVLTDGHGLQREAVLDSWARDKATVRLLDTALEDNESSISVTLCLPILKWDRLEWAIEKATELGTVEIRLVHCTRAAEPVSTQRLERFRRIAIAAAEQSQRSIVPSIRAPTPFDSLMDAQRGDDVRILLYEGLRHQDTSTPAVQGPATFTILVGPAGGLTPDEVAGAVRCGWHLSGLGPRILRAETAALAAITAIQLQWGDLGRSGPSPECARNEG